jgi:site-specific recombinase XerD
MLKPALKIVRPSPRAADLSELELSIREYLLAKRQAQASPGTIEKYTLRLRQFTDWLTRRKITRPIEITRLILREWGATLPDEWQPATRRHATTIVRGFLNWCVEERLIEGDIPTALRLPKVKQRIQRALSTEEVQKLLSACDGSLFGLRDAAIVSLMIDTGLRATEVCKLEVDDLIFDFQIDDDRRINYVVIIGKGGNENAVPFGLDTAARLRAWLSVRPARPGVKSVFVSLGGNTPLFPLTRSGLGNLLQALGNRAGVPDVSPHSLRRTFTLMLDAMGLTTRQIQLLGRWADIRMVELYTQGLKAAKFYRSPADRLNKKAPK